MKKLLALMIALSFSSQAALTDAEAFDAVKSRHNAEEISAATEIDLRTSLKGLYTLNCGEQQTTVLVQRNKFAITGNSVQDTYVLELGKSGQTQSGHLVVQFGNSAKDTSVTLNGQSCEFTRGGSERISEVLGLEIDKAVKVDRVNEMLKDTTQVRSETLTCNIPAYTFEISQGINGIILREETRRTVMKEVPIEERTDINGYYAPRKTIESSVRNMLIRPDLPSGLNEVTFKSGVRVELTPDLQVGSLLVEIPEKGVICRPREISNELDAIKSLEKDIKEAYRELEK